MKLWKWIVLIFGGIATALLFRRPKTYLDAMPELQKAVKKAEEEKKVELSKKTNKDILYTIFHFYSSSSIFTKK